MGSGTSLLQSPVKLLKRSPCKSLDPRTPKTAGLLYIGFPSSQNPDLKALSWSSARGMRCCDSLHDARFGMITLNIYNPNSGFASGSSVSVKV